MCPRVMNEGDSADADDKSGDLVQCSIKVWPMFSAEGEELTKP